MIEPVILSDTELKLLNMIRGLELFDMLEVKYSKQGELMWKLSKQFKGVYFLNVDTA